MLPFYSVQFSTTEINYTFYRIPTKKIFLSWAAATPTEFRFSMKAPKQITHIQKLVGSSDVLERFWNAARVLGDKLSPVLFQLPPFLKKDLPRLEDFLASLPKGIKAAFEFRHASWFDEEVFSALKSRNAALCIADDKELTTQPVITSGFGSFRLRAQYNKADLERGPKLFPKSANT